MSKTIADGMGCSGPPYHLWRRWVVDGARGLALHDKIEDRLAYALRDAPIPGTSPILTVDPWRMLAVLFDGPVLRLRWRENSRGKWVETEREDAETFVAAGMDCSHLWGFDEKRRVWWWSGTGRTRVGEQPLPGTAMPVLVGVKGQKVLTEGGGLYRWSIRGWSWNGTGFGTEACTSCTAFKRREEPADAPDGGVLRYIVRRGVALGPLIGDRYPGETVELTEREAKDYVRRGVLERAGGAATS